MCNQAKQNLQAAEGKKNSVDAKEKKRKERKKRSEISCNFFFLKKIEERKSRWIYVKHYVAGSIGSIVLREVNEKLIRVWSTYIKEGSKGVRANAQINW